MRLSDRLVLYTLALLLFSKFMSSNNQFLIVIYEIHASHSICENTSVVVVINVISQLYITCYTFELAHKIVQ